MTRFMVICWLLDCICFFLLANASIQRLPLSQFPVKDYNYDQENLARYFRIKGRAGFNAADSLNELPKSNFVILTGNNDLFTTGKIMDYGYGGRFVGSDIQDHGLNGLIGLNGKFDSLQNKRQIIELNGIDYWNQELGEIPEAIDENGNSDGFSRLENKHEIYNSIGRNVLDESLGGKDIYKLDESEVGFGDVEDQKLYQPKYIGNDNQLVPKDATEIFEVKGRDDFDRDDDLTSKEISFGKQSEYGKKKGKYSSFGTQDEREYDRPEGGEHELDESQDISGDIGESAEESTVNGKNKRKYKAVKLSENDSNGTGLSGIIKLLLERLGNFQNGELSGRDIVSDKTRSVDKISRLMGKREPVNLRSRDGWNNKLGNAGIETKYLFFDGRASGENIDSRKLNKPIKGAHRTRERKNVLLTTKEKGEYQLEQSEGGNLAVKYKLQKNPGIGIEDVVFGDSEVSVRKFNQPKFFTKYNNQFNKGSTVAFRLNDSDDSDKDDDFTTGEIKKLIKSGYGDEDTTAGTQNEGDYDYEDGQYGFGEKKNGIEKNLDNSSDNNRNKDSAAIFERNEGKNGTFALIDKNSKALGLFGVIKRMFLGLGSLWFLVSDC